MERGCVGPSPDRGVTRSRLDYEVSLLAVVDHTGVVVDACCVGWCDGEHNSEGSEKKISFGWPDNQLGFRDNITAGLSARSA